MAVEDIEKSPLRKCQQLGESQEHLEHEAEKGSTKPDVKTSGWRMTIITISLCLGVFLSALDNDIISTAIPRITDEFDSLADVGWYASAYFLTTCSFQLLYGRLYTYYSVKFVFLGAVGVFELGSLLCAVAYNSVTFILGRAIAGLGSGGIFAGALVIVADTIPLDKRPMYAGFIGSMYGISSVSGPLLGGLFVDTISWRWCFYINLPIGALTMAFVLVFYKAARKYPQQSLTFKEQVKSFDIPGTICFIAAIVCVLLALQWGGTKYAWDDWRIISLLIVFGILGIGFIVQQIIRGNRATVPPRVFLERGVWASCLFIACVGASLFAFVYYIPIWLQSVKGDSAIQSGVHLLPLLGALIVMSIVAGATVTFTGYYNPWVIASTILMSLGGGLMSTWSANSDQGHWIGYQIIFGAGVGCGIQQAMVAVQAVLPAEDVAIGTALALFAETFGGALFVSVANNVFRNRLEERISADVPELDPKMVVSIGATETAKAVPQDLLPRVRTAYNKAIVQSFYVGTAMAALSIIGALSMKWVNVKKKK